MAYSSSYTSEPGKIDLGLAVELAPILQRFGQNYRQAREKGHENQFRTVGGVVAVRPLNSETEFILDRGTWDQLPWSHWNLNSNGYPVCCGAWLHRLSARINGLDMEGMDFVDHMDRNPLDNRICNLRPCTRIQNSWNVEKPHGHRTKSGKWNFTFSKSFPTVAEAEDELRLGRFQTMSKSRTCFNRQTFDSYEEGIRWWQFQAGIHYGDFSPFAHPHRSCQEILAEEGSQMRGHWTNGSGHEKT